MVFDIQKCMSLVLSTLIDYIANNISVYIAVRTFEDHSVLGFSRYMPCQSLPEAGDTSIIVVPRCNEWYEKEVGIKWTDLSCVNLIQIIAPCPLKKPCCFSSENLKWKRFHSVSGLHPPYLNLTGVSFKWKVRNSPQSASSIFKFKLFWSHAAQVLCF